MKKTTELKRLIQAPEIFVMVGAYDAISAKLVEKAGFKAIQCTGFGFAASLLGMPDVGLLSFTEALTHTHNIANAVDIPVMADGDTGFGNAINIIRTIREFENAGAAGINLEDQIFPKRCGHLEGKEIIPMEEMVKKIESAVYARKDPDFIINARTDAIAVMGIEDAIRRANAYSKAGADLIFVEAIENVNDMKRVVTEIDAPVSINMGAGIGARRKTPYLPIEKLQAIGFARVTIPGLSLSSAIKGMTIALNVLKDEGISENHDHLLIPFKELNELLGLNEIRSLEGNFLPAKQLLAKYGE